MSFKFTKEDDEAARLTKLTKDSIFNDLKSRPIYNRIPEIVVVVLLICLLWAYFATRNSPTGNEVIVIENCEYLTFRTYYGYRGLTHKGNCTNIIHNYKN